MEAKNSDNEDSDDMNVDPFIQGANLQEYSTSKHVDPFPYTMSEGPTSYLMSSSTEGPIGYTDNDNDDDEDEDEDDDDDDSGPNAYTASTSTEGPDEYTANTEDDDDSGPDAYTESTSTGPFGYTDDDNNDNDNDDGNNDDTDDTSDEDDRKVNILLSCVEV